jgi:hypothetical protein
VISPFIKSMAQRRSIVAQLEASLLNRFAVSDKQALVPLAMTSIVYAASPWPNSSPAP